MLHTTFVFSLMSACAFKLQLTTDSKSRRADWKLVEGRRENQGVGTDYLYRTSKGTKTNFEIQIQNRDESFSAPFPLPFKRSGVPAAVAT